MLLHQHFIRTAKKFRNKVAFIDRNTNRKITYSKALIASLILARRFKKYPEGCIGIMVPTSAGCAISIVASLMSGKTPVMINYSTGADRNAIYAQKKCRFRTIIASRALLEKIHCPPVDGMVFIEDIMEATGRTEKLAAAAASILPSVLLQRMLHAGNDNDNAVILFTSGSEKDPKAVPLTHRNIGSNIRTVSTVFDLTGNDRMLANLPYFHVFGLVINLWLPLYKGMTVILYANPLDYSTVCSIIRDEKPTMMVGTPSFLWGYLRKSHPGDFRSLRLIVSGADKCPDALREGFQEKHALVLYEGYGTTETSPVISVNTPEHNRPGSVGRVLPGVQVRIDHLETGRECKAGDVGRIMVKGELLMKGYIDDVEETSGRIRQGWYDTGDMGSLDEDGYLWHAGRLKRFIKIGGEMVSLVTVENVLEKYLPPRVECCVVEIPDPHKGARIIAAVTQEIDEKALLQNMSEHLPNIALPRQFIVMKELPKMGSGKIDFRSVTDSIHTALRKDTSRPEEH